MFRCKTSIFHNSCFILFLVLVWRKYCRHCYNKITHFVFSDNFTITARGGRGCLLLFRTCYFQYLYCWLVCSYQWKVVESILVVTRLSVPWFLRKCSVNFGPAFLFSDYVKRWFAIHFTLLKFISDKNVLIRYNLMNRSYFLFALLGFLHKINHDKFLLLSHTLIGFGIFGVVTTFYYFWLAMPNTQMPFSRNS